MESTSGTLTQPFITINWTTQSVIMKNEHVCLIIYIAFRKQKCDKEKTNIFKKSLLKKYSVQVL